MTLYCSRNQWWTINGYSVLVPSKCGSSSFSNAVDNIGYEGADHRKILAVRDPVSRFRSLWRLADSGKITSATNPLHVITGLSPEILMAHIEQFPEDNRHWLRQSRYMSSEVTVWPYNEVLERLGLVALHINQSQPRGVETMPESRILNHYAEDQVLWEQAKKSPVPVGRG